MASTFTHSPTGLIAGSSRTLLYGPVAIGSTAIVFAGTFTNIDDVQNIQHSVKLERYDGSSYTTILNYIPVAYGGSSKCPKLVLAAGEYLYVTADSASSIECDLNVVTLS